MPMNLLLATKNKNKIKEIKDKFSYIKELKILSLEDFESFPDVIEDGRTFEENALKKAKELSLFAGMAVLADDSGLEIDALNGEPGVNSARYAGEGASDDDRNRLVLEKMKDVPAGKRSARFVCVIAIIVHGKEYLSRGICEGVIASEIKGSNGFGYDPIFYVGNSGRTMAEYTIKEKNKISHRAKALDMAVRSLEQIMRNNKE